MEKTQRKVIAVCASWEDEENLNLFLKYLKKATVGTPYLPMCMTFDRISFPAGLEAYLSVLTLPEISAIVLFGEMIRSDEAAEKMIRLAQDRGIPAFMLERQYAHCVNLAFDYADGFEQITRHMVEDHQCTDLVMVAGLKGNPYSEQRIEICRRVLREKGVTLPPERVLYGNFWDMPTLQALDAYFAGGGSMPKGFLCANDSMAMAVCLYLSERGLRVPEDVLVSGFDGISFGKHHEPSITTGRADYEGMIQTILSRTEAWDSATSGDTEIITIPYRTILRRSCGCEKARSTLPSQEIGELKKMNQDYSRHIREMGHFIRKTQRMERIEDLLPVLPPLFSLWPEPYYCAAVLEEADHGLCRTILHGSGTDYTSGELFRWQEQALPDLDRVLRDDSIQILLLHLLQTSEETMGFLVCGMGHLDLREEQRFEEQAMFMSSALSAIFSNHRLRQANDEILRMAEHDFLTGLLNRRGFDNALESLLSARENQSKTLMLFSMDMDHLKQINDVWGHQEGDFAIQCMGNALREVTQGRGICARYGGDEFAFAILTENDSEDPEHIRQDIERVACRLSGKKPYPIAASMGVSACPVRKHPPMEKLMAESDQLLYADKRKRKEAESIGSGNS